MSALPAPSLDLPSPLPVENAQALAQAMRGLSAPSLWWLSGYAAGLAQSQAVALQPAAEANLAPAVAAEPSARLSIVYGSQTGNARRVAESVLKQAEAAGLAVRLLRADAYPTKELAQEKLLYLVFSTQGEGDPSDDAHGFIQFLNSRRAPQLSQLRYAVLGLGDSSYPKFCAIGRALDARLAELGAQRELPLAEADVEIEPVAQPWRALALNAARERLRSEVPQRATVTPLRRPSIVASPWSREKPYAAELLRNQRISGRRSDKDVRHIELDLAGSGLSYEPGDALGVWPENPPALVDAVLHATGLNGDVEASLAGERLPLRQWLSSRRELGRVSRGLLNQQLERGAHAGLKSMLGDETALAQWLAERPLLETLLRWPAPWTADDLVAALRPLTPRLYSIASSSKEVGDEVHLTVDVLRYAIDSRIHVGAASSFLARQSEGARLPVFIEPNERFRLPLDSGRDVIMFGPGTGIAPFRGFVQQRAAEGAKGRNWLLFGARNFREDFFYQTEWLQARQRGLLQRLDLAFSRDQPRKIYVQDRLLENGRELFDWLQRGAHLYVCGCIAMGKDVHKALRQIVAQHGVRDDEAAEEYLQELQQGGRYARDVY